eukprot:5514060-Alexandrium_andersonii.AAC.1
MPTPWVQGPPPREQPPPLRPSPRPSGPPRRRRRPAKAVGAVAEEAAWPRAGSRAVPRQVPQVADQAPHTH